ncbi:MAG: hypothetical protein NT000_03430 [Proteobacteria bacterium]|nr:hypothetical protein [Pseudomonadota bacterium]
MNLRVNIIIFVSLMLGRAGGAAATHLAETTPITTRIIGHASSSTATSALPPPPTAGRTQIGAALAKILNPLTAANQRLGNDVLIAAVSITTTADRDAIFAKVNERLALKDPEAASLKEAINGNTVTTPELNELVATLKTTATTLDTQEAEAKSEAASEKARAAREKESKLQAAQQAALAQALQQQQQQNQGGSGAGKSDSEKPKPPEPPKFDPPKKQDSLSDKLEKALSQKSNSPNLSSLSNNNNSAANSNKEDKKEPFKFDISPKTAINEVKPVKAAVPGGDANSPIDPSNSSAENNSSKFLSGPTSNPPVISSNEGRPSGGQGEEASSPGGLSGGVKGKTAVNNGGAQDIFSSVGNVEYGALPPPIRKASADYSGEGGGGEGGGNDISSPNSYQAPKKEFLFNELILLTNNPRAQGRGLMALVGFQLKDICTKPAAIKVGLCVVKAEEAKKIKNKEKKISFNQQ